MDIQPILELKIFERQIIVSLEKWIDDRELLLLTGARQTGKTSILFGLIQHLVASGKAAAKNIYFFDAENVHEAALLSGGHEEILKIVGIEKGVKKYIFLDEIHYIKNIDRTLKVLVDHFSASVKIIATGSSSIAIKSRFKESMAGRKIIFDIYPLSFGEYLVFSGRQDLSKLVKDTDPLRHKLGVSGEHFRQFRKEYENYMIFGGYPRVVLERDTEKKKVLLDEIYTAYIRKDVSAFFRIDDVDKFNNLIKYVALNSGQIFNKNSASRELGITGKTIERYLNILQMTYVAGIVKPYHTNKTKEILKMPKIYFIDNGVRNSIVGSFAGINNRTDAGTVIETAAYLNLLKYAGKREFIKFWRTKSGSEVDFVIDGEKFYAFECKKSAASFSTSKYSEFILKYQPAAFYVLNLDREERGKIIYEPLFFI